MYTDGEVLQAEVSYHHFRVVVVAGERRRCGCELLVNGARRRCDTAVVMTGTCTRRRCGWRRYQIRVVVVAGERRCCGCVLRMNSARRRCDTAVEMIACGDTGGECGCVFCAFPFSGARCRCACQQQRDTQRGRERTRSSATRAKARHILAPRASAGAIVIGGAATRQQAYVGGARPASA